MLLQAVLGMLALYHLTIGLLSVFSFRATARFVDALYGIEVAPDPPLRYAVRMLGVYALALGVLLVFAARTPAAHREIVLVVAGLQTTRALCRVLLRRELADAFHVPARRNLFHAGLLVAESVVLVTCLPLASR
jgi:hypothetical protein